jgi:hypothetical protein
MFCDISHFPELQNRKCEQADIEKVQSLLLQMYEQPSPNINASIDETKENLLPRIKEITTFLRKGMLPSQLASCLFHPLIQQFKHLSMQEQITLERKFRCKRLLEFLYTKFPLKSEEKIYWAAPVERCTKPILNEKGVKSVLSHLSSKAQIDSIKFTESVHDLKKEFTQIRKSQIADKLSNEKAHHSFITQYYFNDGMYLHYTPIFLSISDEGWKILISDSDPVGNIELCMQLQNAITDFCKTNGITADLYCFDQVRQRDGVSCSIFAINDLIAFNQQEDLFTEIAKNVSNKPIETFSNEPRIQIHKIQYLPAKCMKYTQIKNTISTYFKNYPNENTILIKSGVTLEQYQSRYQLAIPTDKGNVEHLNFRSTYKIYKYVARLLVKGLEKTEDKYIRNTYLRWAQPPKEKSLA